MGDWTRTPCIGSPSSWTTRKVPCFVFWNHMSDHDTSHVNSPFLSGEILGLLLGCFWPFRQGPNSAAQTSLLILLPSVCSWCVCAIWVTLHALAQVRASVQNTLSSLTQPWRSISIAAAPRSFFTHWASLHYGFTHGWLLTPKDSVSETLWMGWDEMRGENLTVKYLKALGPESRLAVCWSCWFQEGV